ncbi:metal-dependent hydrolase [Halorussus litoreus]|uniref:metal-dependent hydrolase n=1 Tax=Halorussus litoreus TaxID=1710536 RepID=UPI000E2652E0|nr:metal-dependent hydrolase [Halorussus litoreus]
MMVGHAMVAFALGTAVAARRWPAERALAFGVVAGAFGAAPDVDMLYAVFGLAQVGVGGVWELTAAFWESSHLVHRAVTHSLVIGVIAAVGFAGAVTNRGRVVAALLLSGLVAVAFVVSGLLGGAVMLAFLLAGVGIALVAVRTTDLGPPELLAAGLLGLLSHPFGDVFTGAPPRFFYPLDVWTPGGAMAGGPIAGGAVVDAQVVADRVVLLSDPTLNLLSIFGIELATIWLAGYVFLRVTGRGLFAHVDARAAVGVAYAIAVVAMPAPTLQVSYHFVFSILALAIVGVAPRLLPSRPLLSAEWHETITWAMTGLAAVSIAALSYALAYVLFPVG